MNRLTGLLLILALLTAPVLLCASEPEESDAAAHYAQVCKKFPDGPLMGLNLAGLCDWNTELPFVDVFLETRNWISQREGEKWGGGPELELDSHGWVKRLDKDCWAEVPLCTIEGGHYPSGVFTVEYKGVGKLDFGNAKVVREEPGRVEIDVDSSHGSFWLRIRETSPDDYIRDIHAYMPGFGTEESRAKCGIWNPDFLKRWSSMRIFRTMDWQGTNGSGQKTWSDRALPDDAVYTRAGAPLEIICDFINRTKADLWYCVPDQADDEYVRKTAELFKATLSPLKKIYVEYSNEVWNPSFVQYARAAEKGKALGFAESDWEAAWKYTARRSCEIFAIFEDVLGDDLRLIRVLPSQAANPYVSEQILTFEDAWRHADAMAIAPYMGMSVPREETDAVIALGIDGVLKKLDEEIIPETEEMVRKQKALADRFGLKLVCYEAGQHLVGLWGANDSEELNSILTGANRTKRMGELYDRYFKIWEDAGGSTMCHFSSVGKWSKWGSWGVIEYADETAEDSPKLRSLLEYAERWNRD